MAKALRSRDRGVGGSWDRRAIPWGLTPALGCLWFVLGTAIALPDGWRFGKFPLMRLMFQVVRSGMAIHCNVMTHQERSIDFYGLTWTAEHLCRLRAIAISTGFQRHRYRQIDR
jgi:hypothetical protein